MKTLKHISRIERQKRMLEKQKMEMAFSRSLKTKRFGKDIMKTIIFDAFHGKKSFEYKSEVYNQLYRYFKQFGSNQKGKKMYYRILAMLIRKNCWKLFYYNIHLNILSQIAGNYNSFIQSPESWIKKSNNARRILITLVKHLLVKYDTPEFMYDCWFSAECHQYIGGFIDAAQGSNIRKTNTGIKLSKRAAGLIFNVPSYFGYMQGLMWCSLKARGFENSFISKIIPVMGLQRFLNDTELKIQWLQILSDNTSLAAQHFNVLHDYLMDCLEQNENYSLKGRNINALVRQAKQWQKDIELMNDGKGKFKWKRSEIKETTTIKELRDVIAEIKVIELLTSVQLQREGRHMKHCVGLYSKECIYMESRIFSIRYEDSRNKTKTLATVEVEIKKRLISQAKAKCNESISDLTMAVLKDWAELNNLSIDNYL